MVWIMSLQLRLLNVYHTPVEPWLEKARAERALEKVGLRGTGKSCGTISRASPSQLSDVWPAEEAWSVFPDSSTRRLGACWRCSSRMWSEMPSPTRSMPRGRPSLQWMWYTPSRGRVALCTALVVRLPLPSPQGKNNKPNRPFSGPPKYFHRWDIN